MIDRNLTQFRSSFWLMRLPVGVWGCLSRLHTRYLASTHTRYLAST